MFFHSNSVKFTSNFFQINLIIFAILFSSAFVTTITANQTPVEPLLKNSLGTENVQNSSHTNSSKIENTTKASEITTSSPISYEANNTSTKSGNVQNIQSTISSKIENTTKASKIITSSQISYEANNTSTTSGNVQNSQSTISSKIENTTKASEIITSSPISYEANITSTTSGNVQSSKSIILSKIENTIKSITQNSNDTNNTLTIGHGLNSAIINATTIEIATVPSIIILNNQTTSSNVLDSLNSTIGKVTERPECNTRRSCNQCASIPTCNWSMEKQICGDSILGQLKNITECPQFKVNFTIENNINTKEITQNLNYSIHVNISNEAKSFKTFLNQYKNKIVCKVDELSSNAIFVNNEVIICTITPVPYESVEHIVLKMNPLHILYFSMFVNDTEIQFENPEDQYTSYYGLNCPRSDCTIGFWEDDLKRYYCQWCMNSEKCIVKQQQSKCDVRKLHGNYTKITDEFSEIEVKSFNVEIEHFEPHYGLYIGGMTISIKLRGHNILIDNRPMTITVAGRQCMNPIMSKDGILTCIVAVSSNQKDLSVGPVVITYKSLTNYVLKSKQTFSFINPKIIDINPKVAPVNIMTMLKITGENLNVIKNALVSINGKTHCKIQELEKDYIKCQIIANDVLDSGELSILFNDILIKNSSIPHFMFANQPSIIKGQRFAGIASGSTQLVIHGYFTGITNPKFYIMNRDGIKYYADCPPHPINRKYQVICYSPNLNNTGLIPTVRFSVGFTVEFSGYTIELISPYNTNNFYIYHEDPDFIDFITDVKEQTIKITGTFAYTDYRFGDIFIPLGNDNCTIDRMTHKVIECHTYTSPGVYKASRTKELKIYVGKNLVGVALRRAILPVRSSIPTVLISSIALVNGIITTLMGLFHFSISII